MNNTTTYNRSMFGLTEVNADTINANNLVLSGPLKVNTITSTAAGQSLSIDALGTGTIALKSGGITKISSTNTETDFYTNQINIRGGYRLRFYDPSNTLFGQLYAVSFGFIYNASIHYFQTSGITKLSLGASLHQSSVPITAPTEAINSNNTRLATTEFVTRATLGLTGITYRNDTFQDLTIIDNNVRIETGKLLSIPNFGNVSQTLTDINTTLTGISFAVDDFLTFFGTNVEMSSNFALPSYGNVKETLDNLSAISLNVNGITYATSGDMTTISNNVTISTGKILSIPSFSNVSSTLTTLTTNATGIIYAEPYPLFVPQTTINQNLILATNKKFTCDESWTKLYTTHDLTDTIGEGYFKGFMYNNGSVFTISTTNPIDIYNGTSSEIVLKCGSQETIFGNDGMSLNWGVITLCSDIQLPTYLSLTGTLDTLTSSVSTLTTSVTSLTTNMTGITYISGLLDRTTFDNNVKIEPNKTLDIPSYPNVETTLNQLFAYSDDFTDVLNFNNPIRWVSGGGLTYMDDEVGHRGIVRLPASDRNLYPVSLTNIFYWQDFKRIDFVFRITYSDTSMFYDIGLSNNNLGTDKSITWRYQNATSPNGWTPRVNGSLLSGWTSAATITTTSTHWFYGSFTHYGNPNEKYIKFYIKNLTDFTEYSNVGSSQTAIDITADYRPYFRAISTGGGTKYLDLDYVSIQYINGRPNPQIEYV